MIFLQKKTIMTFTKTSWDSSDAADCELFYKCYKYFMTEARTDPIVVVVRKRNSKKGPARINFHKQWRWKSFSSQHNFTVIFCTWLVSRALRTWKIIVSLYRNNSKIHDEVFHLFISHFHQSRHRIDAPRRKFIWNIGIIFWFKFCYINAVAASAMEVKKNNLAYYGGPERARNKIISVPIYRLNSCLKELWAQ